MVEYLKIKNWSRWQSYRSDRGQPPWIKVHRCVMRNPEWVELTDTERGQLVSIWLLAADSNGLIPSSPKLIQKLCFMDSPLNLSKFIELDFICQDDAKTTPERRQDDQPEKSRVEENKEHTAFDNAEFYITKKKRKITGKRLETFMLFWEAFDYKRGKAEATDVWLDIPLTDKIVNEIVAAAKAEAKRRPGLKSNGGKPKMAQGWLSGKRWEDETETIQTPKKIYME